MKPQFSDELMVLLWRELLCRATRVYSAECSITFDPTLNVATIGKLVLLQIRIAAFTWIEYATVASEVQIMARFVIMI